MLQSDFGISASLDLQSDLKTPSFQYPKEINTLEESLRKQWLDLGLLQREVAKRIGLDESTITNRAGNELYRRFD
jgi:hypothetical protein